MLRRNLRHGMIPIPGEFRRIAVSGFRGFAVSRFRFRGFRGTLTGGFRGTLTDFGAESLG